MKIFQLLIAGINKIHLTIDVLTEEDRLLKLNTASKKMVQAEKERGADE
ncbi:hypothetical protein L2X67_22025 [Enterobacter ludwigii]|nr:hypothetical protein [Enterobacter ludwigii]